MYGYPRSRGGYSGNYRYSQPSSQEYESFFNPIPLEFLVGQLEKSQAQYDTGYASAIAAKDQFGGIKVDQEDLPYKNQIVSQFVDNTDKMVKDQYGGDWGRASKAIAKSVSEVRGNDFWNASANAQAERKRVQELQDKYGANALIFGDDIRGKSTIDETGKVRKFNPAQVVEKGNWNKTVQDIIGKINPDSNPYGLNEADFGMISSGNITEVTRKKLEKLANDPNIQQAIVSQHPEMSKAFNELKGQRGSLFGGEYKDGELKNAVKDLILGNVAGQEFRQNDKRYMQDWQLEMATKEAANKETISAFSPEREMAKYDTGYGTTNESKRQAKTFLFNDKGDMVSDPLFDADQSFGIITETEKALALSHPAVVNGQITEQYLAELDKAKPQIRKEREANPLYQARRTQFDQINEIITDLRNNNPELTKGKSEWEIYTDYLNDTENKYKASMDISLPITNKNINETIGTALASNINGTEFYLTDGSRVSKDWNEKNGIGDITGLSYAGFQETLRQGGIPLAYNKMKGSIYAEIPVVESEKRSSDGTINWNETVTKSKKTVYFSPDRKLKGVSKFISHLDSILKDSKQDLTIPEEISEIFPTLNYDKTKVDRKGDVNKQEVFQAKDSKGNDEWYSLDEIRNYMAKYVNEYLASNYNIKQ